MKTALNTQVASDTTAPINPSISIDSGASSTSSTSVTLRIYADDDAGVAGYFASESDSALSATGSGWVSVSSTTSYSADVSFVLSSGDGTKTVYVWFKDAAGNVSASTSDSITVSTELEGTWLYSCHQIIEDGRTKNIKTFFTYTEKTGKEVGDRSIIHFEQLKPAIDIRQRASPWDESVRLITGHFA